MEEAKDANTVLTELGNGHRMLQIKTYAIEFPME